MAHAAGPATLAAAASRAALTERATAPAYWLELPNSSHLSVTFSELLSPLLAPPGFDPRAALLVVDTYPRAFFDTHPRGMEQPLLGPTATETDITWRAR